MGAFYIMHPVAQLLIGLALLTSFCLCFNNNKPKWITVLGELALIVFFCNTYLFNTLLLMKQRKYVINEGKFIPAFVQFHKEIPVEHSKTSSGGEWYWDKKDDVLYLFNISSQFGGTTEEEFSKIMWPAWAEKLKKVLNPYAEHLLELTPPGKKCIQNYETLPELV